MENKEKEVTEIEVLSSLVRLFTEIRIELGTQCYFRVTEIEVRKRQPRNKYLVSISINSSYSTYLLRESISMRVNVFSDLNIDFMINISEN